MKHYPFFLLFVLLMATTACRDKKVGENPFFTEWETPYGVPPFDEIRPEHYMPAFERAMSEHLDEIEAITSDDDTPDFENVMLAYDRAGLALERVSAVFGMLCAADKNDQMQQIQGEAAPMLSAHFDRIALDEALFAKIKAVYDKRETLALDPVQMRLVEKVYNDFVRGGALLDPAQKERLKSLNERLASLGVKFGNNVLAENNAFELPIGEQDAAGLPDDAKAAAREKAAARGLKDTLLITLDAPSRIAFLTYADRRDLREQVYKGYIERGNHDDAADNKALVDEMARLRSEKARLLGYPDYASYVIANQMAGTPEAVYGLLDEIWTPALETARTEVDEMTPLLQKDHPGATFEAWDWWYYADKVRKEKYAFDEEAVRPYFSMENARSGIFFLANRLYGITFRPVVVPVYHKDCMVYEVLDRDNTLLGLLYFDFYPRASKSNGAWCGTFRNQRFDENGARVAPIVSIVCNFTPPAGQEGVALFTLDDVETLFHEFGHALHNLFAQVKYRSLANVEGDFVELPSQIMENWAIEPALLRQYAHHYRSGEVIPDNLIERIRKSSKFNQGFVTTELVAAALIDLDIHSIAADERLDVNRFEADALSRRGLIPQIASRYRYPYFLHIFDGGYSAGYYFYIWAEVLDKDAYVAFQQTGDLFDKQTADKFRTLLAAGGQSDGMTLYRNFRGADPDKRALLIGRGLMEEEIIPADTLAGKPDIELDEPEAAARTIEATPMKAAARPALHRPAVTSERKTPNK